MLTTVPSIDTVFAARFVAFDGSEISESGWSFSDNFSELLAKATEVAPFWAKHYEAHIVIEFRKKGEDEVKAWDTLTNRWIIDTCWF